jgi:hypothetical protein
MPVVTFTLLKEKPAALKTKLGQAVNIALENARVPRAAFTWLEFLGSVVLINFN